MNSTRKRSIAVVSVLRQLTMPEDSETAVVRAQDESPNDRNDRGMYACSTFTFFSVLKSTSGPRALGIRKATAWYSSHISMINPIIRGRQPKPRPTALLLTDDVQNRIKGEKDGIKCSSGKVSPPWVRTLRSVPSVRRYVESLGDKAAQLLDLLSAEGDEIEPTRAQSSSKQALYPEVTLTQASYQ